MINWYRKYIMSIRKDLVIILIIDILFLLIMELILKEIPAPYSIFMKMGSFFETLAVSFIASFIFYIVQVHLPRIKEKENIFPYIASMFNSILDVEKDILTQLLKLKMEEITEESIKEKVNGLDLYSDAPLIIGGLDSDKKANWIEYCLVKVQDLDRKWNMMMNYSAYLDSECMALLYRMQSSGCFLETIRILFSMFVNSKHKLPYKYPDTFVDFWHFIDEQQDYYDRVLVKYNTRKR